MDDSGAAVRVRGMSDPNVISEKLIMDYGSVRLEPL
jgi:hypothetical protein